MTGTVHSASAGNPPLALRIGFAGHRAAERLGDPKILAANLDAAFALAADAASAMTQLPLEWCDETLGQAFAGPPSLRLVTGVATGADRIAIARWRAAARGPVHALTPYIDPKTGMALTDEPSVAKPEDRIGDLADFETWTSLDGAAAGRHGHGELARWMVRHCDLLVVVWDGKAAAGAGGTGDTVRLALHKGIAVLWIQPDAPGLRWLDPSAVWQDDGATEAAVDPARRAAPASLAALASLLFRAYAPPVPRRRPAASEAAPLDPEVIARRDYAMRDPMRRAGGPRAWLEGLGDRTLWRAFNAFKTVVGSPPPRAALAAQPELPADVAQESGFILLSGGLDDADGRANRLSNAHRSQQVILLALALLAVIVGVSAPASARPAAQLAAISAELVFAIGILALWSLARRGHRHRRWSDARRLAERFRAARATFPLGVDIADDHAAGAQTWTEWRARAVIRAAGVTGGVLDQAEVTARARWASADLIEGQARYHAREAATARTISERMQGLENTAYITLTSALFLAAVAAALLTFDPGLSAALKGDLAGFVVGVTVLSVIVPSMGAVGLALEATNGFSEMAERCAQLAPAFEEFAARMKAVDPIPAPLAQEILRQAASLAVSDADSWRQRLVQRRLMHGG